MLQQGETKSGSAIINLEWFILIDAFTQTFSESISIAFPLFRLWNLNSGTSLLTLTGHTKRVKTVFLY